MKVWLTPPAIAQQLGIDPSKVIHWIHCGELRGVNVATHMNGRPRYRIDPAELEAFIQRRQSRAISPIEGRRRRQRKKENVTEYF